jgi:PleD family two-component response regulator
VVVIMPRDSADMLELHAQRPLVLIASEGEWLGRSLENVLESNGYSVLRIESGRKALEVARRTNPDAIILDDSLPDIAGVDVCRALRDDPLFHHATPIFITAAAQHAGRVRTAAYAAGAWEYCTQPLEVETLLAKLATFIRAGRDVESFRSKALIDRLTGLYSQHGLRQWVEQLGAQALRKQAAMACVAVMPDASATPSTALSAEQASDLVAEFTTVCRNHSRRSDVVGYLGDSRVAILAPDTDAAGVERLIDRLQEAVGAVIKGSRRRGSGALRAGYCAVSNLATANLAPVELVSRAEIALDYAARGRTSASVSFEATLG